MSASLVKMIKHLRFNLGIPTLLPEWKKLFSIRDLKADCMAGATVACVAIPLSLAIALASGVSPAVGLLTAIIGSIVCALFGGTPLSVSGPAAAMSILVAAIVESNGFAGLLIVTLIAGCLQLFSGVLRLGKFINFVPFPVIAGFTAGIGAIILIGQLPRVLGLHLPENPYVFSVLHHVWSFLPRIKAATVGLSLFTIFTVFLLPRYFPRLPAPLIAVILPSIFVSVFKIPVEMIGAIPNSLPLPAVPHINVNQIAELFTDAFIVFVLASLETLLSSSVVDKLAKSKQHDPDQELVGQGLGNIVSAFFGGIPVTGVIARSALNIQAGAKTRRSSIIHGILLILSVYFCASFISQIPIAVLSGVLIAVALRMMHPREFIMIWRTGRAEGCIYLATFISIIGFDLLAGIKIGILIALIIALFRMSRVQANVRHREIFGPTLVTLKGSLTFLSSSQLDEVRHILQKEELKQGIIFDLSHLEVLDTSGAAQLLEILNQLVMRHIKFALKGVTPEHTQILQALDGHDANALNSHLIYDESELEELWKNNQHYGMARLAYGAKKFNEDIEGHHKSLFKKLAHYQKPHTLFIACSDSRVNTNLITSTEPGELFTVRNVGNIIPPFDAQGMHSESAAIEFAILHLGVKEIVVCGHAGCGAIQAILAEETVSKERQAAMPNLSQWIELSRDVKEKLPSGISLKKAVQFNVLLQLENLKTYPIVRERLAAKKIRLHGWYYSISKATLNEWDEEQNMFVPMGTLLTRAMEQDMQSGTQFQTPYSSL
ncbi:MAG: dauA 2 [Gammaproteobacteria bacterium]|jgi:carbonic anhydrase|nr:dauA 2 [Gammaproteobacteria bacterium]